MLPPPAAATCRRDLAALATCGLERCLQCADGGTALSRTDLLQLEVHLLRLHCELLQREGEARNYAQRVVAMALLPW